MYIFICLLACLALTGAQMHDMEFERHIQMTFDEADANNDGHVTKAEFQNMFKAYDLNGDGQVTRQEYNDHFTNTMLHHLSHAMDMFNLYDRDGDHLIETYDFDNFFPLLDANGDGQVTRNEHTHYWHQAIPM